MGKSILGVVAGLFAFVALATLAGLILRASWPAYASVASPPSFTLPMLLARLSIGALATLATGAAARLVARSSRVSLVAGAILVVLFVPQHIAIWPDFPVWYHLTFLTSLVPLALAGGTIAGCGGRS